MRKFIVNFCLLFSFFSFVQAQTLEQKIYIDFGAPSITTESPDMNDNYWNNATDGTLTATPLELVNSQDEATGFVLSITKKFSVNSSGEGALKDPDPELLGDFAIASATGDYFYVEGSDGLNGAVRISNLDPAKGYKFNIFGSRTNPGIRTATYTLTGYNTVSGTHQTTGTDLGGEGINQNISNIFVSDYVFPNANGDIMLEVSRYAGSIAHINVMKIEEYSGVSPEPEPEVKQSIYIDLGAPTITTDSPDENGNYWNNATDGTLTAAPLELVNSKDKSTDFTLSVTKRFSVNATGNGALKEPDSELLGDFAVPTATGDYFYVEGATNGIGELTFKNLNPMNGYRFHVFGSRSDANERTAVYTFYGLNTFAGIHHTTGTNLGGEGVNQNNRDIFKSDVIFPNLNGEIIFEVTCRVGTIGHVNVIKIEEYENVVDERPVPVTFRIIDYSKGRIPDSFGGESEANVFAWLSNDLNSSGWNTPFYGDEENPTGAVKALIKEDDKWIWSATVAVPVGNTYTWNPYFRTSESNIEIKAAEIEGLVWPMANNADLAYAVAEDGTISGVTTLTIPYLATIDADELAELEEGDLQGASEVTLTGNYTKADMEILQHALGTNRIITSILLEGVSPDTDDYFAAINPNCLKYVANAAPADGKNYINSVTKEALTAIILVDGSAFDCPEEIIASQGASYTRECYTDGGWESIILPFVVESFTDSENFMLEKYSGAVNDIIRFTTIELSEWEANKAYILKHKTGTSGTQTTTFVAANGATIVTAPADEEFTGVYSVIPGEGKYILALDGQKFGKGSITSAIPAFRAYFESATINNLPSYSVEHENGGTTAVDRIETINDIYSIDGILYISSSETTTISVYGIDGVKVAEKEIPEGIHTIESLAKGIYLVNGQKVIIK